MALWSRRNGNLPAEVTSFVGRRAEIKEITSLLSAARLVTLTGVGGVGKTRLALAVAGRLSRAFPDGVWLVELAPVRDGALVAHAIFEAFGVAGGSDPLASLVRFVRDKRLLVVLDNCEQVVESCAEVVRVLLAEEPGVSVLATSREALRATGEQVWPVAPLPFGHGQAAVELFYQRAAAVLPSFVPTAGNQGQVADVCGRLEGIPLAIELAAVWLRILSIDQLSARLDNRLELLSSGRRGPVPHQRTLRATVDWSFELCNPAERSLWARLSVFAGDFDLDAVEEICAGDAVAADEPDAATTGQPVGSDVIDVLDRLVSKSILICEHRAGLARYRLLDTLREYGLDRLRETGAEIPCRRAHAARFLRLAEQAEREWFGPAQDDQFQWLHREQANLQGALEYLIVAGEAEDAQRLCAALWYHWIFSGRTGEGRFWLGRALALPGKPSIAYARALCTQAMVSSGHGHLEDSAEQAARARDLAVRLGDEQTGAWAAIRLAATLVLKGDTGVSPLLDEALHVFGKLGESDSPHAVLGRNILAGARLADGDLAGSIELSRQGRAICHARGDTKVITAALLTLSRAEWVTGDLPAAAEHVREALRLQRPGYLSANAVWAVEFRAWYAADNDEPRRAALLLGGVARLWREFDQVPLSEAPYYRLPREQCAARARAALGDAGFDAAVRQGNAMTVDEIIAAAAGAGKNPKPVAHAETAAAAPSYEMAVLTPREREVAALVAQGLSNKQISARLVISPRTAESHVQNILTKLDFAARSQIAAALARGEMVTGS